jgi:hypothetical protein
MASQRLQCPYCARPVTVPMESDEALEELIQKVEETKTCKACGAVCPVEDMEGKTCKACASVNLNHHLTEGIWAVGILAVVVLFFLLFGRFLIPNPPGQ